MVNVLVVSPLLGLVGFYDPPFQMRVEGTIAIQTVVPIDDHDVLAESPQLPKPATPQRSPQTPPASNPIN